MQVNNRMHRLRGEFTSGSTEECRSQSHSVQMSNAIKTFVIERHRVKGRPISF